MKVTIKNFDNKLFVLDSQGKYRRVVHTYIYQIWKAENPIFDEDRKIPLGVACAVISENNEVTYGYSQVSPEDKYNKQIGLKIAVGRALTVPLEGPDDFDSLAEKYILPAADNQEVYCGKVSPRIVDGLYTVYDRAERTIARGWKEIGL